MCQTFSNKNYNCDTIIKIINRFRSKKFTGSQGNIIFKKGSGIYTNFIYKVKIKFSLNPFFTRCQYTDSLFQLEIAAFSVQIHDLMDDVLTQCQCINPSSFRHLVLKVCGSQNFVFLLEFYCVLMSQFFS